MPDGIRAQLLRLGQRRRHAEELGRHHLQPVRLGRPAAGVPHEQSSPYLRRRQDRRRHRVREGTRCTIRKALVHPEQLARDGRGDLGFFGEEGYDFANDPRFITLVITDITAFEGSGSTNIPVKYFAGFYATGWDISSHTTGCPGENDPHPIFGTGYKRSKDNGDVWGHFINVIEFSSAGLADDQLCNFDELGNCIAVLVE